MTDVHNKKTRSYNMSQIKDKNTKPEMLVRKFLFSQGFRYRLHDKMLPGKPDIVLPKYKTVVFVHGCFWHGHNDCKYYVVPKTRTEWWLKKITNNIMTNANAVLALQAVGWKVIILWECKLKKKQFRETMSYLIEELATQERTI